jgi:4-hydroxy-L-threonine phosphate dehydrogenase PdxA
MLDLTFEWDGETRILTAPADTPDAIMDLVAPEFDACAGTHIPAAEVVRKVADRLSTTVTDLRVVASNGEQIPDDAQG